MKKIILVLMVIVLCSLGERSYAQVLGTRYLHADTLALTTNENNTTFTTQWEQVTIYSSGEAVLLRLGAPDVGSWSSREWMLLPGGSALTIGPNPKLTRLTAKVSSGTSTLYLLGYKKTAQF